MTQNPKAIRPTILFAPVNQELPYFTPIRHYPGDAGFDLSASRQVSIDPKCWANVPTNLRVALPDGAWASIVGRSSTFFKRNLIVNTAIIDNGYRGELWASIYNPTDERVTVKRGERLIQLILHHLMSSDMQEVAAKDFPAGDRGENGFGSTGGQG
jgi:dUTP pyrophosphatase